uniref:Uncharacterized protein n=1 Tax=Amphimedon queenslandica TaxID=400682 RepID=A0A1X7SQF1_AMPQE
MSNQVFVSQGQRPTVGAGHVQRTEVEVKGFGKTRYISGGCFHQTNFIIKNTQGQNLRRYWYMKGVVTMFLVYCFLGLLSFFHVSAASVVIVIDILWILLFSQYVNIACKVIPIVIQHPVLPALQTINQINKLLEVRIKIVDGRYICLNTVNYGTAGLQVGNLELQYNEARSAGLFQLSSASGTIKFQVLSPIAKNRVRQTRAFSFLLLLGAIIHFLYALGCLIVNLVVSGGMLSTILDDDN